MDDEIIEFAYKHPKKKGGYEFRRSHYRPHMVRCAVRFEEISDVLEENAESRLITQSHNWGDEYSI